MRRSSIKSMLFNLRGSSPWAILLFIALLPFSILSQSPDKTDPPATTSSRRFYSEDFLIFGKDSGGQDFLLKLIFCRKEIEANKFLHYRFASLMYRNTNVHLEDNLTDENSHEVSHGFLSSYKHSKVADLSTRDSFRLDLFLDNQPLTVEIPNLRGEFVTKAFPEYTRFSSESEARISIAGQSWATRAYVQQVYSSDYAKYLFFPGYDSTKSHTLYFVLWDESGNFLLIDTSTTEGLNKNYPAHTWALFKEAGSGKLNKAFEIELRPTSSPKSWTISVPAFNVSNLTVSSLSKLNRDIEEGIAGGEYYIAGQRKKTKGFYEDHYYN